MGLFKKIFYKFIFMFLVLVLSVILVCFFFASYSFASSDDDGVLVGVEVAEGIYTVSGTFESRDGYRTFYAPLKVGHTYKLTTTARRTIYCCSSVPKVGDSYSNLSVVTPDSPYIFTVNDDSFMFVCDGTGQSQSLFTLYDITATSPNTGFTIAITGLVDSTGASNIWSVFETSIPFIAIVVICGFGFYQIFHAIREVSNGKERM